MTLSESTAWDSNTGAVVSAFCMRFVAGAARPHPVGWSAYIVFSMCESYLEWSTLLVPTQWPPTCQAGALPAELSADEMG